MDKFFEVLDAAKKKVDSTQLKSVPCEVVAKLDKEMVQVKLIANGAIYTVANRSGNDVAVGENVTLFYNGSIITESQAYIGAVLNKRSDKYYTKPETDDMLNGMSIEKMSKAEYDALLVKNPNRVYFVYNTDNTYDIYIGTIKINGEGGGYDDLPTHIKVKIQEYLDSESVVVDFKDGTLSDDIELETTTAFDVNGNASLTIKPRAKCILLAFVCYVIEDELEVFKRFEEAGFVELSRFYTYDNVVQINPSVRYGVVVLTKNSNGATTTLSGNGNTSPKYRCRNISFAAIYNAESVNVIECGNGNTLDSCLYSYYVEGESRPYHLLKGFKSSTSLNPTLYYCSMSGTSTAEKVYTRSLSDLDEYNFDVQLHSPMIGMGGHLAYDGKQSETKDLLWMYGSYTDTTSERVQADAGGSPYPHGIGLVAVEINERSET